MSEAGYSHPPIVQKAFEISYALFRVTTHMKHRDLAEKLQKHALELLGLSAAQEFESIKKEIKIIDYCVRLGVELSFINLPNGKVLLGQLNSLEKEVQAKTQQSQESAELPLSFQTLTSILPELSDKIISNGNQPKEGKGKVNGNEKNQQIQGSFEKANESSTSRQTAIANIIRQSETCRLKNVQGKFPDVSERTLRYDIQKLIDQGLIERVGAGGPFSYYRAKAIGVADLSHIPLSS